MYEKYRTYLYERIRNTKDGDETDRKRAGNIADHLGKGPMLGT